MADDVNVNTGTTAGSRAWRNLLVSGYEILTKTFTVESGVSLAEGEVVALRTSTEKIVSYEGGGGDGYGTAYAVAAEAIDASAGDTIGTLYIKAVLNKNKLTVSDTGDTVDDQALFDELRERGIFLVDSVGA